MKTKYSYRAKQNFNFLLIDKIDRLYYQWVDIFSFCFYFNYINSMKIYMRFCEIYRRKYSLICVSVDANRDE